MVLLVVDDEAVQLESMRRGLRSKGYAVLGAKSAEEALDILQGDDGDKIELVITDYAMPHVNGIELLHSIRSADKSLPAILMTAYGEKELVIDALRSGCQGYIEKPFTLEQLLDEIKRTILLSKREATSQKLFEHVHKLVHQINNPLVCIIGNAELASCHINDAEAIKKNIDRILESTDRISKINDQILRLGRGYENEESLVDINALVDECLNMFHGLMTFKGIKAKKEMFNGELKLYADRFALQQLFNNILLNAIDAMEEGPRKILSIRTSKDEAHSSVNVCIEDSGCGIPEEDMDAIFLPYVTSKERGTGLGLAVAKNVVERHHGRIDVDSRPGEGSVFRITLPVRSAKKTQ